MNTRMTLSRHEVVINGENVRLQTLLPEHASQEYAAWLNDPIVNQFLETRSVTIPELRTYVEEKFESDTALLLGIFWNETGDHIGNVKLEPIDLEEGVAMMGILVGDKNYWGRGVGTEVTNLITQFAFDTLHLSEVRLGVISKNKPAIHVYEKCGYVIDRIEKDGINHDGVLFDKIHMKKCVQ